MSTDVFKILPTPAEPPARPVFYPRYDGRIKIINSLDDSVALDFITEPRYAEYISFAMNQDPAKCKDPNCEVCR